MKKARNIFLILLLIAASVIGCVILSSCNPDDDGKGESAIEFSAGTLGETDASVNVNELAERYSLEIEGGDFKSASSSTYTEVTASEAEAYALLYRTSGSGWSILMMEPPVFYKNDTLVVLGYNEEEEAMVIVTVVVKSGVADKLRQATGVTYSYSVTQPAKTVYAYGEELDLTGFALVKRGSDNTSVTLVLGTDYTIDTSSYNKLAAGEYVLPYALVNSTDLSGSISVTVQARVLLQFNGGSAASFKQTYSDTIVGKITVTPPAGVEGVSVSYRSSQSAHDLASAQWTSEEPQLTGAGLIYVEVKFSKDGYEDKTVSDLKIEINEKSFDNADQLKIQDIYDDYDGLAHSAAVDFDIPAGAELEYEVDGEWTAVMPSFTAAGRHTVFYRITKPNYQTVADAFLVQISKAEVDGFEAPVRIYVYENQTADFGLTGIVSGDKVTYSVDNGTTYLEAVPQIAATKTVKIKVARGENHESSASVSAVYVPENTISLTAAARPAKKGAQAYAELSADSTKYQYLLVSMSGDAGQTWGEWIDLTWDYSDNLPMLDNTQTAEYTYRFRFISGSGYMDYSFSITLPYRVLTSLEVITEPDIKNYILGDTFSSAGLVIKKIYDDGYTQNAAAGEYELFDFDKNIMTDSTVLNEATNSEPISARIGEVITPVGHYFRINVYDMKQYVLPEEDDTVQLRVAALPGKAYYNIGEDFDYNGIRIEVSVPSVFGERWVELPASRYAIAFDEGQAAIDNGGKVAVKVTAKRTYNDIPIPSLTAEFDMEVAYPFVGPQWYLNVSEDGAPPYIDIMVKFVSNSKAEIYFSQYSEDTLTADYTADANGSGFDIEIVSPFASNSKDKDTFNFVYSASEGLSYGYSDSQLQKKGAGNYVLTMSVKTLQYGTKIIQYMTEDSKVSQAFIDSLASFGNFYLTDEITDEGLITSQTVFTADATIYCIYNSTDYSDKPFIGNYAFEDILIIIRGTTIEFNGIKSYYTAEESEGVWTLESDSATFSYNSATDKISVSADGQSFDFDRIDSARYAVVSLVSENGGLSEYCKSYKIEKGGVLQSFVYSDNQITMYTFADYDGEAINEDTEITITDAARVPDYINTNYKYGAYGRNFVFNREDMTVVMTAGTEQTNGRFVIDSIDNSKYYMTLTFTEVSLQAELNVDIYPVKLEIANGDYAGQYANDNDNFYKDLPFIKTLKKENYGTLELFAYGQFNLETTDGYMFGRFEVTAYANDIYTISFTPDGGGEAVIGSFNATSRVMVYNGEEFVAPPRYEGEFSYRGQKLNISHSRFEGGGVSGDITDAQINGDETVITIEVDDTTLLNAVYNGLNDTLTFDGVTYGRYNPQYHYPFIQQDYYNGDTLLKFDSEGNVTLGEIVVGILKSVNYDGDTIEIVFDYFDGSAQVTATYYMSENKVVIGEAVYAVKGAPYADAVFVNKVYQDANGNSLYISDYGYVQLNGADIGSLANYDPNGTFQIEYEDNLSSVITFDADTITTDTAVYTLYVLPYAGAIFVNTNYTDESGNRLYIDEQGNVYSETLLGVITNWDEAAGTFSLDYNDGVTPDAAVSYDETTLTLNDVVYNRN
jgi:hypothetical protein